MILIYFAKYRYISLIGHYHYLLYTTMVSNICLKCMDGRKCMITKLVSVVDDIVGGRVEINKTVIGIGV